MPFPSLSTIDPFDRVESPLSDSGKWWSPRIAGGFTPSSLKDFQQTHIYPFVSGDEANKYQDWDNILVNYPGPALAIRTLDPGPGRNQAISLYANGIIGIIHRVLRFDWNGNGYWIKAQHGSSGTQFLIQKSIGWHVTTLASTTVTSLNPVSIYVGAMVINQEISVWYGDVTEGNSIHMATSVIDDTYAFGFLGFGGEGGVFGSMTQSGCRGSTTLSGLSEVWISSIRDPHHATAAGN